MHYTNKYLEAEKTLAALKGYTDITSVGDLSLFGTRTRGNIVSVLNIPRWCKDSAAAFDLQVEYELEPEFVSGFIGIFHKGRRLETIKIADHENDTAMAFRWALVQGAIAVLKTEGV